MVAAFKRLTSPNDAKKQTKGKSGKDLAAACSTGAAASAEATKSFTISSATRVNSKKELPMKTNPCKTNPFKRSYASIIVQKKKTFFQKYIFATYAFTFLRFFNQKPPATSPVSRFTPAPRHAPAVSPPSWLL